LRPFELSDADALVDLCRERLISGNTAHLPSPYTRADAEAFLGGATGPQDGEAFRFAICIRADLAGAIGLNLLNREETLWGVGYRIGADYRNKRLRHRRLARRR
jgi:RimJ/RimL family protein N-acetyltransferase